MPDSNIPPLNSLYFYLTSYCNLNCIHCWISPHHIDNIQAPEEAPIELLKDIIDQALPLGLKNIKITGGEPFLNKNIFPLMEYAFSKNIGITIETNGTLIDEKIALFLKNNGVSFIAVSLDGPNKEIHEQLRGMKDCFDRTLKGIKLLTQHGFNVQAIMSAYKDNLQYLEETVTLAEQCGVKSIKINCISGIARGASLKDKGDTLSVKDYVDLNNKIDTEIQPKHEIRIILDIPPAFIKIKNIKERKGRCGIKNILGVLSDGSISICGIGEVVSSLKLGDVRNESLEYIWNNNATLGLIREGVPHRLEGICSKCIFKAFCLGKCRAEAYYSHNNNLLSGFSFCEEAYREGLFPQRSMISKKEVFV